MTAPDRQAERPKVRRWCEDSDPKVKPSYGPRLFAGYIDTDICDGGCPRHPLQGNRVERLLKQVFASCGCVAFWQFGVEWRWGKRRWFTVLLELRPRWHSRFQIERGIV